MTSLSCSQDSTDSAMSDPMKIESLTDSAVNLSTMDLEATPISDDDTKKLEQRQFGLIWVRTRNNKTNNISSPSRTAPRFTLQPNHNSVLLQLLESGLSDFCTRKGSSRVAATQCYIQVCNGSAEIKDLYTAKHKLLSDFDSGTAIALATGQQLLESLSLQDELKQTDLHLYVFARRDLAASRQNQSEVQRIIEEYHGLQHAEAATPSPVTSRSKSKTTPDSKSDTSAAGRTGANSSSDATQSGPSEQLQVSTDDTKGHDYVARVREITVGIANMDLAKADSLPETAFKIDWLVLAPMSDNELAPIIALLHDRNIITEHFVIRNTCRHGTDQPNLLYKAVHRFKYVNKVMLLTCVGVAQTVAATVTQSLLTFFKPENAALIGCAGSIDGDVRVGSVVVGEQVHDCTQQSAVQEPTEELEKFHKKLCTVFQRYNRNADQKEHIEHIDCLIPSVEEVLQYSSFDRLKCLMVCYGIVQNDDICDYMDQPGIQNLILSCLQKATQGTGQRTEVSGINLKLQTSTFKSESTLVRAVRSVKDLQDHRVSLINLCKRNTQHAKDLFDDAVNSDQDISDEKRDVDWKHIEEQLWWKPTQAAAAAGFHNVSVDDSENLFQIGDILSTGFVIKDQNKAKQLVPANRKTLAVEMEATGFLAACADQNVKGIVIRGVSDTAGSDKKKFEVVGKMFQHLAAQNATNVFLAMLDVMKPDDPSTSTGAAATSVAESSHTRHFRLGSQSSSMQI
jgi:nucleoside phosphorylase